MRPRRAVLPRAARRPARSRCVRHSFRPPPAEATGCRRTSAAPCRLRGAVRRRSRERVALAAPAAEDGTGTEDGASARDGTSGGAAAARRTAPRQWSRPRERRRPAPRTRDGPPGGASGVRRCGTRRPRCAPPKPNELLTASRSPCGSSRGAVATSMTISGSCWVRLIVGGATRLCSASAVNAASIAPAPPSRWPVDALVAETTMSSRWSPKTRRIAWYSAMSPTGVEVACAFTWTTSSRAAPACSSACRTARAAALPSGSGAVMWNASEVMPAPATSA